MESNTRLVDPSTHFPGVRTDISYVLLMITAARCEYIFLLKNLKPLLTSRITKIFLRKRKILFIVCAQIGAKSSPFTSSIFFAKLMVSVDNLMQPTLPNKMVQPRTRIKQS